MRKGAVQLCRKNKITIHARGHAAPLFSYCRLDVTVKRRVDLDQIEKVRQIFNAFARLERRRVDNSLPILIRPARHADFDLAAGVHVLDCTEFRGFTAESPKEQTTALCVVCHTARSTRPRSVSPGRSWAQRHYRCWS